MLCKILARPSSFLSPSPFFSRARQSTSCTQSSAGSHCRPMEKPLAQRPSTDCTNCLRSASESPSSARSRRPWSELGVNRSRVWCVLMHTRKHWIRLLAQQIFHSFPPVVSPLARPRGARSEGSQSESLELDSLKRSDSLSSNHSSSAYPLHESASIVDEPSQKQLALVHVKCSSC